MSGFGLQTPRGTGTSGYLQKSVTEKKLSGFREKRDRQAFEEERRKKRARMSAARREASADMKEFNRKREIEVKCMELRESLEEHDASDSDIERQVKSLRERLSVPAKNSGTILTEEGGEKAEGEGKEEDGEDGEDGETTKEDKHEEYTKVESKSTRTKSSTSKLNVPCEETTVEKTDGAEGKEKFAYVPRYPKR